MKIEANGPARPGAPTQPPQQQPPVNPPPAAARDTLSLESARASQDFARAVGKDPTVKASALFMDLFSQFARPDSVIEGEFIVKLKPGFDASAFKPLAAQLGISDAEAPKRIQSLGRSPVRELDNLFVIKLDTGFITPRAALAILLNSLGAAEFAEPNYRLKATPTQETLNPDLWGLNNTGQNGGKPDADIDLPEARARAKHLGQPRPVVVGVIDTGVNLKHRELEGRIWTNEREASGRPGVDDDSNGYVDDLHGWDFVSNDSDPSDENGHGTHVSGTIAGRTTGVSPNARVMALRFLDAKGSGSLDNAIKAIKYAVENGAHLTSNSWGGGAPSRAMWDAIKAAHDKRQLFIAAAGNESNDNDASPSYPASYTLPNILSVAATDRNDQMASFSNYGKTMVDLGAPGKDIYSAWKDGGYKTISGTSMATPHVSGAAAEVLAYNPGAGMEEVERRLLNGDPVPALDGKTFSGKRLNLDKALAGPAGDQPLPPSQDTPPASFPGGAGQFKLRAIGASMTGGYGDGAMVAGSVYALVGLAPILDMETGISVTRVGGQTVVPIDAGLRLHVPIGEKWDPYLGAGASYQGAGAFSDEPTQFGGYVKLGTEYKLSKHLALDAHVGHHSFLTGEKKLGYTAIGAGLNLHF